MKSRFTNERTKSATSKFSSLKMKLDCSEQRRSSYWLRMDGERKWKQAQAESRDSKNRDRALTFLAVLSQCKQFVWKKSLKHFEACYRELQFHGRVLRRTLRTEILRRKPQNCFFFLYL